MASSPAGRRHGPGRRSPCRFVTLAGPLAALALVVVACGIVSSSPPPATPTDFPGITGRLAAAQISVSAYRSGDAGCSDPDLVPAAISFHAAGLDQATPVTLYLYVFNNRAAWDRHRAQIGPCAQSYVTDPQTFGEIEQSPYIVAGQGPWAPGFEAALRKVLVNAAGTGG
jgi:hypothetical protein